MAQTITLLGDEVVIGLDDTDFYGKMLSAIADHVFRLLGPEFDKAAYVDEVSKKRPPVEIGQELAIPVSMLLSLNLGYCLGQLKMLGQHFDCDKALKDVYDLWRAKLNAMILKENPEEGKIH